MRKPGSQTEVPCANGVSWGQNLGHLAVKRYDIQSPNLSPCRMGKEFSAASLSPGTAPESACREWSGMCKSTLGLPWWSSG